MCINTQIRILLEEFDFILIKSIFNLNKKINELTYKTKRY